MFVSVRYPKLNKSYKTTAKMNQDKLVDKMSDLVIEHKKIQSDPTRPMRGGSMVRERKKKIKTFVLN